MTGSPQYQPPTQKSVADIAGPWVDPDFESGLIQRCRRYWSTPIGELPNQMLATYLRQSIAVGPVAEEARRRLEHQLDDQTELYDGELRAALDNAER
ncbi:MAG: hypothetical protein KF708_16215 [Pirellulales bacterium]|nr:hypothetical protein [Pirellulales bacterium]